MSGLRAPEGLDLAASNLAAAWKKWRRDWTYYAAARELNSKPVAMQVGTFFNCAGPSAQEVASHFAWQESDGLISLLDHFDAYCNPRKNIVRERYEFYSRDQQPGETISSFLATLRQLVTTCEFPDADSMVRDRLCMGVRDRSIQRALLKVTDLTLQTAVDIALSEEASRRDQQLMGRQDTAETVSAMSRCVQSGDASVPVRPLGEGQHRAPAGGRVCQFCALSHPFVRAQCPAWGKVCRQCGGMNHFAAGVVCPRHRPGVSSFGAAASGHRAERHQPSAGTGRRAGTYNAPRSTPGGSRVATVEQPPASEEPPIVGAILETGTDPSRVHKTLHAINGEPLTFLVDSGSQCNVIGLRDYERVSGDVDHVHLVNRVSVLRMYDGTKVATLGRARLRLQNRSNGRTMSVVCRVISKDASPILSLSSSVDLGLIQVRDVDPLDYLPRVKCNSDDNHVKSAVVDTQSPTDTPVSSAAVKTQSHTSQGEGRVESSLTAQNVLKEYQDVFDTTSIGCVLKDYVIVTDPTVRPVADPPRRVRVHVRDKLKAKLADLTHQGLITPVTSPTPWVSNLVVVDKPSGDIRICLDPQSLNDAVLREHYPTPTLDEVTSRLSNAKVFSVVDASRAFWQIGLSEASANLCCFHTPFGRFRWEVLPYGIKSAPEVWQRVMHDLVGGLSGVEVIADDFIIFGCGSTQQEAMRDHDKNLLAFLDRARSRHLRLNPDKFRFKVAAVKWMGHILSDKGLQPDPAKVKAITDLPVPTSVSELKRFLGMVGYLSRYVPNISDVLFPLRQLTQRKVDWFWSPACQEAFQKVKGLLTSAPVLRFYDPRREATVQCDASKAGLGAVLLQEGHPVMYCSRSLTQAETAYSQIEKELLAIVFAMTRLDQFVYGRPVTVQSDHKPLEAIMTKPQVMLRLDFSVCF